MTPQDLQASFRKLKNNERAVHGARFFKTGKGEYGEGDRFLGITVPTIRTFEKNLKSNRTLEFAKAFLASPWHEERVLGTIMLTQLMKTDDKKVQKSVVDLYVAQLGTGINNWDLVDIAAPQIIGGYLIDKKRDLLLTLARSKNLWKKRAAIIATLTFIRQHDFSDTIALCELFLSETHDLMHKACGWMLREMGKKNVQELRIFLEKHSQKMPRTMLRYAIEHLDIQEKTLWMKKK